jgi:hypothetical protein
MFLPAQQPIAQPQDGRLGEQAALLQPQAVAAAQVQPQRLTGFEVMNDGRVHGHHCRRGGRPSPDTDGDAAQRNRTPRAHLLRPWQRRSVSVAPGTAAGTLGASS